MNSLFSMILPNLPLDQQTGVESCIDQGYDFVGLVEVGSGERASVVALMLDAHDDPKVVYPNGNVLFGSTALGMTVDHFA